MKCSRCGNIMPNDAKYCDRCGEPLRKKRSRYEYDYDDYDDDYEYELQRSSAHRENSKGGKIGSAILIFLTVVAVCVTVLLALNMYLPSKNKADDTQSVANNKQQEQVQSQPKQDVEQEDFDESYDATGRDLSDYYYAVDYYYSNYNDSNAYLFPGSDSSYIDPEELSGCTDSQLAYIRNEIFARHGYIFKSDKYNDYFGSKSWYYPNSYATDNVNDLNAYEKYNVELIKSLE